jgi:hypothetical protein
MRDCWDIFGAPEATEGFKAEDFTTFKNLNQLYIYSVD